MISYIAALVLLAFEKAGFPLLVRALLIFENSGVFLKRMSSLKLLPKRALIPAGTACSVSSGIDVGCHGVKDAADEGTCLGTEHGC